MKKGGNRLTKAQKKWHRCLREKKQYKQVDNNLQYHIPPEDFDYIQGVTKTYIDFTEEVIRYTIVYVLNDKKKEQTKDELQGQIEDLRKTKTLGKLIKILLSRYNWDEADRILFGSESLTKTKITNEREQLSAQNLISKRNTFSHRWSGHIEEKNNFDKYCKMQTMILLCQNRIQRLTKIIQTDMKQESQEILQRIDNFFSYYRKNDRLHHEKHKYTLLCIFEQSGLLNSLKITK